MPVRRKPIKGNNLSVGTFRVNPKKGPGLPADWTGTYPEFLVYRELVNKGENFSYQTRTSITGSDLGGRYELGGLIADFLLPDRQMVINPLSDYYHYRDPSVIARERLNALALASMGITVVWIDSDALVQHPKQLIQDALMGIDHSKMGRGIV